MRDLFSSLPAPLPLYILLQLPNLKALYSAILSSPHLYAVFRLHSHRVFNVVVQRSIPADMLAPLALYIRIMHAHYQHRSTWQELKTAATNTQDIWQETSPVIVFHAIAQAVRIHDLAEFVLRCKLDYLGTLTYEKLADPGFRYDAPVPRHARPQMSMQDPQRPQMSMQNPRLGMSMMDYPTMPMPQNPFLPRPPLETPKGTPISIPPGLRDPDFVEEGCVVYVLWLLTTGYRVSKISLDIPEEIATAGPARIQKELLNVYPRLRGDFVDEVAQSVTLGLVLQPSHNNSNNAKLENTNKSFDILQTYKIPHPPCAATSHGSITSTPPTSPCFSHSPPINPATLSEAHILGSYTIPHLSISAPTTSWIREMYKRPCSPLYKAPAHHLTRLGFGFWNRARMSEELGLDKILRLVEVEGERGYKVVEEGMSVSDQWFRMAGLQKQEEAREKQGWGRSMDLQV